ncbi:glucosamine-6-phosphate deaminase [Clostridia bacterium]|nr:glucosamine-6-phosphate deaminase [Clostridia bacterium]
MRIYTAENYDDMSRKAANILSAQVILKPNCVLGLATGSTPLGIYRQLIEWYNKGDVDFSEARSVNLDEYVGLGPDDDQSYRWFMNENFFRHINIKHTDLPDGLAADPAAECIRYESVIASHGGVDMQLLGLGHNGHIGFNEPGASFETGVHHVKLTEATLKANKRFFPGREQPTSAFTMGIRSIMQARRILLVVSGKDKAEIVRRVFKGAVTSEVPASILQIHNNVTLVGDREALSLL